jgi:hypothetical protein
MLLGRMELVALGALEARARHVPPHSQRVGLAGEPLRGGQEVSYGARTLRIKFISAEPSQKGRVTAEDIAARSEMEPSRGRAQFCEVPASDSADFRRVNEICPRSAVVANGRPGRGAPSPLIVSTGRYKARLVGQYHRLRAIAKFKL